MDTLDLTFLKFAAIDFILSGVVGLPVAIMEFLVISSYTHTFSGITFSIVYFVTSYGVYYLHRKELL